MNIVYENVSAAYPGKVNRVAEIDGRYWPYRYDSNTGRAEWRSTVCAGGNSPAGVKYVSESFASLPAAKRAMKSAGY